MAWTLDCYHFLVHIYRSDISNYAVISQREFIMTEQQFEQLEEYCREQMRAHVVRSYMDPNPSDMVCVKKLVQNLRTKLKVTEEINNLLFKPEHSAQESLLAINFFNAAKKVLIRAAGPDKNLNLRMLISLIHELRVKLEIYKAGLGPDKIMRLIDLGDKAGSSGQTLFEGSQE